MKLYYSEDNGTIYYAVLDRDAPTFSHSTNIPLVTMEIDEIEDNRNLIIALRSRHNADELGYPVPTYHIEGGILKDAQGATVTVATDTDKATLKSAYIQALADLADLQAANLNTVAKLEIAVKAEGAIIEKLLKFIAKKLL